MPLARVFRAVFAAGMLEESPPDAQRLRQVDGDPAEATVVAAEELGFESAA